MESTYKVKLGTDVIEVNSQIANVCQSISEFIALSGSEGEIPINDISKQTFQKVIKFCEVAQYKNLELSKVTSNEVDKNLDPNILAFVKDNVSFNNLELFAAALQLRIKPLIKAISTYLASQIYFKKNSVEEYQKIRAKLEIREITQEDSRKISDLFPLLNK